jgi:hypothetical protein
MSAVRDRISSATIAHIRAGHPELAKADALNFSEQVQKFRHRFVAESAVEKRATISKGGLMVRLLACVVPVVLLFAFFTTIAPAQTAGGNPTSAGSCRPACNAGTIGR